jgi:hypothetical protein
MFNDDKLTINYLENCVTKKERNAFHYKIYKHPNQFKGHIMTKNQMSILHYFYIMQCKKEEDIEYHSTVIEDFCHHCIRINAEKKYSKIIQTETN